MTAFKRIQVPDIISRMLPGAVEKAWQSSKIIRKRCLMSSETW